MVFDIVPQLCGSKARRYSRGPVLTFRQLFDPASATYSYLLAHSGEAVLIAPVLEQVERDAALIRELGVRLLWTLETHVHADHVTGASQLKQMLGSRIAIAEAAGTNGADRQLNHGDRVAFGARALQVRATPGHTASCLTYVLDDSSMAFTGDCLLIRGCGRTDFQGGSATQLYRSVRENIFTLPDACLLYPAHDYRGQTVTTVAEEKANNPRLGLTKSADDFAACMAALNLPYPKKIDIALPANLRCGRADEEPMP
jgi:glyoxylase-like metal-dependent hydrolase (beta-lactamase superfamily II)